MKKHFIFSLLLLLFFVNSNAQEFNYTPPNTRILFIMDASQSMLTQWESGRKMNIAKKLLTEMIDSLKHLDHIQMALRVYGHQSPVPPQDCNDTKLEVPFSQNNTKEIKEVLRNLRPKGTTPIAHSLELAGNDFPPCTNCRNVIILITDGIESCDGDPCAVSYNLQKKGIVLKPFIIGVGLDIGFRESFDCVGKFYNATDENRFKEVLEVVVSQAINSTTAQINLMDENGRPTESNVPMTFYDSFSGQMKYNFVHTINHWGNPDTLRLDPLPTYNLVIHTIPPVYKDSVELIPGKHNVIAASTPQGDLEVVTFKNLQYRDLEYIVRQKDSCKTLNVQKVNTKQRYLTGRYEVEVLTIPRIVISTVEIAQSHTTTIKIPKPGIVTFYGLAPQYGAIFSEEGTKLKWVCDLDTELPQQTLAMQPGNYRIITRARHARESVLTINRSFSVSQGSTQRIDLR
jgi:Ca-activated chloride channel family protein